MFQPEEVERDKYGYWIHSVFESADEDVDLTKLPVSEGMEFHAVDFFDDASDDLQQRYEAACAVIGGVEDWSAVIHAWEPKKPDSDGWFLIGLYDTEDGPRACFARQKG